MASCIPLTKMVQQMNLKNVTPEIDISQIKVHVPDINRPALQLTGYFDHFAYERVHGPCCDTQGMVGTCYEPNFS